jgi:pyruvate dehydrogenase E2 component (dihydrolipoamide acetyltransferase)
LARSMATEKGIDLNAVNGTGDGGRIVKRDIEEYTPSSRPAATFAGVSGQESFSEEKVSQMRKVIARRLAESKFGAPHFYLTMEIDMENSMTSRKAINAAIEPEKISFNDMVIKAAAAALKKHPGVNASWLGDKIRYNDHVHIGVAVAVDEGLLVPVIRFADSKPMAAINAEVKEMAGKARNKKLQPSEMEGNTFTISNLGMFGIEEFTAIINPPDACIMAVGTIVEKPVVKNGKIVVGHTMKVTLSCDHRVVDGAVGSAFLQTFKKYMENPVMMLAV